MNTALKAAVVAFAGSFEVRKRDNDEKFWCLKDDAPEWMTDAVHAAHGDFLPDDIRYHMIAQVAQEMAEVMESGSDFDDARYERLDGLIPIYNWDRLKWVSSNLNRAYYCDEAVSEGVADGSDFYALLAAGIDRELSEIWFALESFFEENEDELAEEEADEDADA